MKFDPYSLVEKYQGAIHCDENKLDLFDYYDQPISSWKPVREFESYDSKVKCILDIETTGLSPLRERVIYIGLKYVCEEKNFERNVIFENRESEKQLLLDFLDQFERATPHILITHNGFLFDIPFIIQRLHTHEIYRNNFRLSHKTTTVTSSSHNGRPISFYPAYYKGVDIVDTYVLAGIYDKSANTLPNLRLKDLAIHFGIRDERRLELTYREMMACWESGDDDTMIEYLEYDLEDTYELSKKLVPVYWAQYQLVPDISFQYCCIASPALKWQKLAESGI